MKQGCGGSRNDASDSLMGAAMAAQLCITGVQAAAEMAVGGTREPLRYPPPCGSGGFPAPARRKQQEDAMWLDRRFTGTSIQFNSFFLVAGLPSYFVFGTGIKIAHLKVSLAGTLANAKPNTACRPARLEAANSGPWKQS